MEIRIILDEFIRKVRGCDVEPLGELRYIQSNRHQGVAEARIVIRRDC
jgi:hypothetical protein